MLFYIILLIISIIFYVTKTNFNYWQNLQIDGPKPIMLFGNMFPVFMVLKHFGEIIQEMYKYVTHI